MNDLKKNAEAQRKFQKRLKAAGKYELRNIYVPDSDRQLIKDNKPHIQSGVDGIIDDLRKGQ